MKVKKRYKLLPEKGSNKSLTTSKGVDVEVEAVLALVRQHRVEAAKDPQPAPGHPPEGFRLIVYTPGEALRTDGTKGCGSSGTRPEGRRYRRHEAQFTHWRGGVGDAWFFLFLVNPKN